MDVDEAQYLAESESYKLGRIKDWQHRQQLIALPDFKSRLQYWINEVCKESLVFRCSYREDLEFVLKIDRKLLVPVVDIFGLSRDFELGIYPRTDEEKGEIHQFWMNWYRKEFAEESRPVEAFAPKDLAGKPVIAFHVRSLESLINDLEKRLSSYFRKSALLQSELESVIQAIDAAGAIYRGIPSILLEHIKAVRLSIETNSQYDFTFKNDDYPGVKATKLACIWDIIHYEAYLKDKIDEVTIAEKYSGNIPISEDIPSNQKAEQTNRLGSDFSNLFSYEKDDLACLSLLQRFGLVRLDGTHDIGERDKYRLMALVEALQQRHLLPPARSTSELTSIIARHIGLPYTRARSGDRKKYDNSLREYLNKLNDISIHPLTWQMVVDKWTLMADDGR